MSEYHKGMKNYLLVYWSKELNGQCFAGFWADDEEHAIEQFCDEMSDPDAGSLVRFVFVSESEIVNAYA